MNMPAAKPAALGDNPNSSMANSEVIIINK
jgi:hypothetical protein